MAIIAFCSDLSAHRITAELEQFSNSCALFSCVQGGSFLRKKPLIIVLSVCSNWRTAIEIEEFNNQGKQRGRPIYSGGLAGYSFRTKLLPQAAVFGAVDCTRGVVEPVVEPDAVKAGEAAMAGEAHVALLAADGGFAPLQARSLTGVEPSSVNALGDALLLMRASLVDGDGVVLGGLRSGLSKTKG